MSGKGSRLIDAGFTVPKYMITSRGKSLFEWSLLSLEAFFGQMFIFACLTSHDLDWIKNRISLLGIQNYIIIPRDNMSKGQAQTAYDVMHLIPNGEPIWIYNIDTFVSKGLIPLNFESVDGYVPVFRSSNPAMSFVRKNLENQVVEIKEKVPISDLATVGLYGFKNKELYIKSYYNTYLSIGQVECLEKEEYIAPIYNSLLLDNRIIWAPLLDNENVHPLGTPLEVLIFDDQTKPPIGSVINTTSGDDN